MTFSFPGAEGSPRAPADFRADNGGAAYGEVDKLTVAGSHSLGYAVAIDGDTIVAGDRKDSGSVYVFSASDGAQLAKLMAGDAAEDDKFGEKVAIDGDTIAIAAENEGNTGGSEKDGPGAVYVFRTNDGGATYDELEKVTALDAAASDWFGTSVAIEGGTLVAGARGDDDAGSESGSAYVFALLAELTPEPTPEPGEPTPRPVPAPTPWSHAAVPQPTPRPAAQTPEPTITFAPTPSPYEYAPTENAMQYCRLDAKSACWGNTHGFVKVTGNGPFDGISANDDDDDDPEGLYSTPALADLNGDGMLIRCLSVDELRPHVWSLAGNVDLISGNEYGELLYCHSSCMNRG